MSKRAAIYIRVSSERQAKVIKRDNETNEETLHAKVSPEAQEKDCRERCQNSGYQVYEVYKDISKYRVGKKLVEPSGTRADRPGLQRMLADAYAGKYDFIVAWREDRLYRSYRPMLDVLDCIDDTDIDIELVKETFDKRIAPVKAWAARMELDAKQDRFMMGVAGRLSKGKVWVQRPPYGYKRVGDYYEIEPSEAQWVEKVFEWYAKSDSVQIIRERLISSGAKQRRGRAKRPWNVSNIYRMLRYELYWTGKQVYSWNDEHFEVDIPKIVSPEVAKTCKERRESYKQYPAGNYKHKTLAAGFTYCAACGTRMIITTLSNGYTRKKDGKLKRYSNYGCTTRYKAGITEGCAGRVSVLKLDAQIWDKVWSLISVPGILEESIQQRIVELQSKKGDAEEEYQDLNRQLDDLLLERQAVIGWARKKMITEDDLETQLLSLTLQQREIERQLSETKLLLGNQADRMQELAELFRKQVALGFEQLNEQPESQETKKQHLELRQKIVRSVVERVDVYEDKTPKVHFVLDLQDLAVNKVEGEFVSINIQSSSSSIRSKLPGDRPRGTCCA